MAAVLRAPARARAGLRGPALAREPPVDPQADLEEPVFLQCVPDRPARELAALWPDLARHRSFRDSGQAGPQAGPVPETERPALEGPPAALQAAMRGEPVDRATAGATLAPHVAPLHMEKDLPEAAAAGPAALEGPAPLRAAMRENSADRAWAASAGLVGPFLAEEDSAEDLEEDSAEVSGEDLAEDLVEDLAEEEDRVIPVSLTNTAFVDAGSTFLTRPGGKLTPAF